MTDPVLVEVTRGACLLQARVESFHIGAAVAIDASGAIAFQAGDIDRPIYPRSAVKALQQLPLVESGAADKLGLTDDEIALACSSHSGQEVHVAAAASMLRKAGRDEHTLECGVHWPNDQASARKLIAEGAQPSAIHNNCSGKHSGFICLACARGEDPAGYVQPDHPTMRQVTAALSAMTGAKLDDSNRGTDGCSIPTFAIPLRALALGFARFGSAQGLSPERAKATRRIREAVAKNPLMVAGTGRFDTRMMTAMGARVFCKGGAEGVHCAAIPELGLGIAVKCDDGAGRGADVATAALIDRFLRPNNEEVAALVRPVLNNWNGIQVGEMRPAGPLL